MSKTTDRHIINALFLLLASLVMMMTGCSLDRYKALSIIPDYERFYIVDTIRIDNPFFFSVEGVSYVIDDSIGICNYDAAELKEMVSKNTETEYYILDEFEEFPNYCAMKYRGEDNNIFSKIMKPGQRIAEYDYRTIGEGVWCGSPRTEKDSTHMFILALMNIAIFNTYGCLDCTYQRHVKSLNPYNYYLKIVFPIIVTDSTAIPIDELENLRRKQTRPITKSDI